MEQLFCLWPWWLTDWRQLILHLQNHSFPDILQQADDLIVAEFGQVDAIHCFNVVTHIQLITSAKQRVASVEISSPWASLIIFPTLLSWINTQAQKGTQQGPCLLGCGWFLRAGVLLRVDEMLRDPSSSRWLYTFQVLYCICCYPWFFPKPLPLLFLKSIRKWNEEKIIFSCSAPKELVLQGQIICILDVLEVFLSSQSLSMLLLAFWTLHYFWYLH